MNLIDVRPMPRGGWVATCECGAHRTYPDQVDAWRWVTEHRCSTEVPERSRRPVA